MQGTYLLHKVLGGTSRKGGKGQVSHRGAYQAPGALEEDRTGIYLLFLRHVLDIHCVWDMGKPCEFFP